jgi:hypothetical protein
MQNNISGFDKERNVDEINGFQWTWKAVYWSNLRLSDVTSAMQVKDLGF